MLLIFVVATLLVAVVSVVVVVVNSTGAMFVVANYMGFDSACSKCRPALVSVFISSCSCCCGTVSGFADVRYHLFFGEAAFMLKIFNENKTLNSKYCENRTIAITETINRNKVFAFGGELTSHFFIFT